MRRKEPICSKRKHDDLNESGEEIKKHPRRKRTRMLIAKTAYIGRMDKVGETLKVLLQVGEEGGTRMKS